jgi:hypothetical protein
VDNFASLDPPGDPGGVKVVELSGMKAKSADSVTVLLLLPSSTLLHIVARGSSCSFISWYCQMRVLYVSVCSHYIL